MRETEDRTSGCSCLSVMLGVLQMIRRPSVPSIIFSLFLYYWNICAFASTSLPFAGSRVCAFSHTPFSDAVLMALLQMNATMVDLQFILFSHFSRTDWPSSQ